MPVFDHFELWRYDGDTPVECPPETFPTHRDAWRARMKYGRKAPDYHVIGCLNGVYYSTDDTTVEKPSIAPA